MTARAMTANGIVGQSVSDIQSYKDFYIKWTSPKWLREKDSAIGNIAIFNQTNQDQNVKIELQGALVQSESIRLKPGINFIDVPRKGEQTGELILMLKHQDKIKDRLAVNLNNRSDSWPVHFNKLVSPQEGVIKLDLPSDARNITLRWMDHSRAAFYLSLIHI